MLTGERRWASSRRSGMTVLGKVAVPKPINLPSQRLENNGQNREVEIVPKGTLSWGSRPSSTSSVWGNSVPSPNTDGGTGSPSHLSGRPSSAGSGTRPSTASSDLTHEPSANAWGPSSRPCSASASLTSNQNSLISLRPHSAETRPGSSQLSRFAEPVSDNSTAWGAAGTADKLGTSSSKNDSFSLTSGDFPTLGLDRETSGKNIDNQDHGPQGRPGSSSGGVSPRKEDVGKPIGDFPLHENVKSGNTNSWRRENHPYGEDGARPNVEKWHTEPRPYPNNSIPPQHYDAWHAPPINNHPGGVWYRGPPGGPPFGPPVAPGGFPMEPFPYYRPQVTVPALANPQPAPPPGSGPRGRHPKNGDMYRPHMHDAYVRPGMPIRPGFYPGPVPYDGYYGHPMGYANSNEREIPSMAMAMGHSAYNRFSGPNAPDISNSHGMSGGYGPGGKVMVMEQMESGCSHDTCSHDARNHNTRSHDFRMHDAYSHDARGQVSLKQFDRWEEKDEQQKFDDNVTSYSSCSGKGNHPRHSSWEGRWSLDHSKGEEMDARKVALGGESSLDVNDQRAVPMKPKTPENLRNSQVPDCSAVRRLDNEQPGAPVLPEVPAAAKDPSLIQKIEGLNAKVRATDGWQDSKSLYGRVEHKNKLQVGDARTNFSANGAGTVSASHERTQKDHNSVGERIIESTVISATAISRKSNQPMHGRADHHGKGRFSTTEADQVSDSPSILTVPVGSSRVVHGQDHTSTEATEIARSYPRGKEGEHMSPVVADSSDTQLQRAKTIELAKQRLKQREMEEEERARDQKAKALAKLEELNRRTQAGEGSTHKMDIVSSIAIENKQEEGSGLSQATVLTRNARVSGSVLGPKPKAFMPVGESNHGRVEKFPSFSSEALLETPKTVRKEPVLVHDLSGKSQKHCNNANSSHDNGSQVYDNGASKQKGSSHMHKHSIALEKMSGEKLTSSSVTEGLNVADNATVYFGGVPVEISSRCDSNLPINQTVITESSVQHKKKSRSGKNKQASEEKSAAVALASSVSEGKSTSQDTTLVENSQSKTSDPVLDPPSMQTHTDSKSANQPLEQHASLLPNEDAHARVNSQGKSQHSRRMLRNPPTNRSVEKLHSGDSVVWAPVRPQNKTEASDEVVQKTVVETLDPSVKSDQQVQRTPRNKRAEIERYIPKPAAKEVAQQGSSHQAAVPLINQTTLDENVRRSESATLGIENAQTSSTVNEKVVSAVDGQQSKPGKAYGAWRKRGSAESPGSFPSDHSKNVQKSIEHPEPQRSDVIPVNEQFQSVDEWNTSDGWNMPEMPVAPVTVPLVKDQGVAARGKRQHFKGQKGSGSNRDSDDKRINIGDSGKGYSQSPGPGMHQVESSAMLKEKHAVGDQSVSHWQPKSQLSAANQQGSGQPVHDQSQSQDVPHVELQGTKRERKNTSHKGRLGRPAEFSALPPMDNQLEQRVSTGFHRNTIQNSRFVREHESHGDWGGGPGKDHKQHSAPANRERHRHNSHYEYQPVGPHNNNKANNVEPPKDGSHNSGSRFKERGQSHPRRGAGHSYGQQIGTVQVDASDK